MAAEDDTRDPTQVGMQLLGASLRDRRQRAGWTMRELGERTGLSFDAIVSIEHGRRLPTLKSLYGLANAHDTTVRELLAGVYPWDNPSPR